MLEKLYQRRRKEAISNAVRKEPLVEEGQSEPEQRSGAVAALLLSLRKHFTGLPNQIRERRTCVLTNLRCPSLQYFKWYKDVYLNKVYLEKDCSEIYWTRRFFEGLPMILKDRVYLALDKEYRYQVPCKILSYGELISIRVYVG